MTWRSTSPGPEDRAVGVRNSGVAVHNSINPCRGGGFPRPKVSVTILEREKHCVRGNPMEGSIRTGSTGESPPARALDRRSRVRNAIELPHIGYAFECVAATVLEGDSRPDHEVLHRGGDEHLTGLGETTNAGTNVHSDAGKI
jgi:hypothetical protein